KHLLSISVLLRASVVNSSGPRSGGTTWMAGSSPAMTNWKDAYKANGWCDAGFLTRAFLRGDPGPHAGAGIRAAARAARRRFQGARARLHRRRKLRHAAAPDGA